MPGDIEVGYWAWQPLRFWLGIAVFYGGKLHLFKVVAARWQSSVLRLER